jgi:hypothetical protein
VSSCGVVSVGFVECVEKDYRAIWAPALNGAFQVEETPCFTELLLAIDEADAREAPPNSPINPLDGITFSLEQGQVWASWTGVRGRLRLGHEAQVSEMMRDFLAQMEVAARLIRNLHLSD